MAKKKYQIVGRVVSSSQQGVPNARVEAWDKDFLVNDLVSSAETGADGRFQMQFDSSYFSSFSLDRQPDLFFKIYYGDQLVGSTEDSVLWNVAAGKTEMLIEVDLTGGSKGTAQQPKGDSRMSKKTDLGGKGPKDTKDLKGSKNPKDTKNPKGPGPKGPGPKGPGPKGPGPKGPGPKGPGPKGPGPKGPKNPTGPKNPKNPKSPKNPKRPKTTKGKGKHPYPDSSDFVCVIISRKCAIELATAISLAVGFPVTPGKKGKKGKKGKGGKGKGKGGGKTGGGKTGGGKTGGGGKGAVKKK